MNPPYSCPGVWMKKLQAEVELGRVTEAIALVGAATDTNWLSPILRVQPACFWKGRIKFLDSNYKPKLPALMSHCLVYWGNNYERFIKVFEEHGVMHLPLALIKDLMLNSPSTQLSSNNQVLGESSSLLFSPSTQVGNDDRMQSESLSLAIPSNIEVSSKDEVLGKSLLPSIQMLSFNDTVFTSQSRLPVPLLKRMVAAPAPRSRTARPFAPKSLRLVASNRRFEERVPPGTLWA